MAFLTPSERREAANAEGLAEHNSTFPPEDGRIGNFCVAKPRIPASSMTHSWRKSHRGKKELQG